MRNNTETGVTKIQEYQSCQEERVKYLNYRINNSKIMRLKLTTKFKKFLVKWQTEGAKFEHWWRVFDTGGLYVEHGMS